MKEYDSVRPFATSCPPTSFSLALNFGFVGLVCLCSAACNSGTTTTDSGTTATDSAEHPLIGTSFPALDVEPLVNSAAPLTLVDVADQVVLINFWGPWCVPCRVEMPHIVELEKRHRGRDDFRFVSISCSSQQGYALGEETERYVTAQGIEFPVYSDSEGKTRWPLIDALGSNGEFPYPTTVLLDRQGKVCGYWAGYEPGLEKEVAVAVEQALADE